MTALAIQVMSCRKRPFQTFSAAQAFAMTISRNTGNSVTPYHCSACDHYHTKSSRIPLNATDILILEHLARGLRDKEIGQDLGITETAVNIRIYRMMARTGTISRANLVFFATNAGFLTYDRVMGEQNGRS